MPLLVGDTDNDACLCLPFNRIEHFGRRLPPFGTIIPLPDGIAIRFCPNIGGVLGQVDSNSIFLDAVDTRYICALIVAIVHGVVVVPRSPVVLEAPLVDAGPLPGACCESIVINFIGYYCIRRTIPEPLQCKYESPKVCMIIFNEQLL